jgi:hypothetical protein
MERLSVSLDERCIKLIDNYTEKYGTSKADIIRKALKNLKNAEEAKKKAKLQDINIYIDFLANMEHVILDIALWDLIFSQIGDSSEEFWEAVHGIGVDHSTEYHDKGLTKVKQILEYVERTNWYKLSVDSENSFTLILPVSKSRKFIRTFFEGLFSQYPRKVVITEEHKKIRIKVL